MSVRNQNTLSKPISISGTGLFTGSPVHLTLKPAKEDYGIVFHRVDFPETSGIQAKLSTVSATPRCTVLSNKEYSIQTVEHLLAALSAMHIDNVEVLLDGPEVPILDGSSMVFVKLIQEAGVEEQSKKKKVHFLKKPVSFSDKDIHIIAVPSDEYRISYTLKFPETFGIATQFYSMAVGPETFKNEIAEARTFSAYEEIAPMIEKGLVKGGSLDNGILIREGQVMNPGGLRMPDEFVRHKILDVIGDLSLCFPFVAHVIAIRSGHASNYLFAKLLENQIKMENVMGTESAKPDTVFDVKQISAILPHRYPFLLVDRVVSIDLEKNEIMGMKNITMNEQFFQGHFPGAPIMPGVLILEALAQTGGILVHQKGFNDRIAVLLNINNAKFRRPVVPGDQLMLHARGLHFSSKGGRVLARAMVNNQIAVEAEIAFALVNKDQL